VEPQFTSTPASRFLALRGAREAAPGWARAFAAALRRTTAAVGRTTAAAYWAPAAMGRPGLKASPAALAVGFALLAAGCANSGPKSTPRTTTSALPVFHRQDMQWLERVNFGSDAESVAELHRLGRERYLDRQLLGMEQSLPVPIGAELTTLAAARPDPARSLAEVSAEYKRINAMSDGADKEQARKALSEQGNKLAYAAIREELLRALYSPSQLDEQLVWFWLNHFSVHQYKANLRWLVGDYADRAIRPHALGHFEDLVLATLEHPAMLQYLDNNQNAVGHVNENYARELMELHTLGVNGGYSQQDVQQLARVLTGVGINAANPPKLKPEWQKLYRRDGAFEFNPARHDFGDKLFLGHAIKGRGFAEVDEAVSLIVRQPACARFISRELATYFVADDPPARLVDRMAQTFMRTDGDIAQVLREMFLAPELDAALGGKFKDPMRFVISSVRFAYDGRTISNTRPMLNWLNGLGEAPFGRATPDGYPLTELAWASSGQMSRRFEIARAIGSGNAGLFDAEDGSSAGGGFPQLSNRLYYEAVEPFLGARTKDALARANSQQEWNTFLLASPDFNYE
jgi:uncharacterized protein (DUF1800 family)